MRTSEYLLRNIPAKDFRRLHKPFFVDWDDFLSHQHFRRFTMISAATLTISEMLPLPERILFRENERSYITEYLIELYERQGEKT
jgi:hypothetical protein